VYYQQKYTLFNKIHLYEANLI